MEPVRSGLTQEEHKEYLNKVIDWCEMMGYMIELDRRTGSITVAQDDRVRHTFSCVVEALTWAKHRAKFLGVAVP